MYVFLGNPSKYAGLIYATVPKHIVAVGGSFGACGGGDALPSRPVQVQGGPVCPYMCLDLDSQCVCTYTPEHCRSSLIVDNVADRGEDWLRPSHCSVPVLLSLACFLLSGVCLCLASLTHVQFPSLTRVSSLCGFWVNFIFCNPSIFFPLVHLGDLK